MELINKNTSSVSDISTSALGAGLIHAWIWSVFYSNAIIPFKSISSFDSGIILTSWLIMQIVTLGFIFMNPKLFEHFEKSGGFPFAIAAGSIGTILIAVSFQQSVVTPLYLSIAGATLLALFKSMLFVLWGKSYSRMKIREVQIASALFLAFGAAIYLIISQLNGIIAIIITAALPLASYMLLRSRGKTHHRIPCDTESDRAFSFPLSFAVCLIVFAAANSFLRGLGTSVAGAGESAGTELLFASIIAMGLTTSWTKSVKTVFSLSVILLAMGLGMLPFGTAFYGTVLVGAGWICFEVVVWVLIVGMIKKSEQNAIRISAQVWLLIQIGMLVGTGFGSIVSIFFGLDSHTGIIISLVLAYLVLMSLLLTLRRSFLDIVIETEFSQKADLAQLVGYSDIASKFGLTEREAEVLNLLMKGRDMRYIADSLFVSVNTAKTHMRHIYQKTGVSSKQELITKIEVISNE